MITQIKKNLSVVRKIEILEKLLMDAGVNGDTITVDYIGILSDICPYIADVHTRLIPLTRGMGMLVKIVPRCYRDLFKPADEEPLSLFVIGLIAIKRPMYGNLRINGKKIEY